jgi:hypothetical protein
LLFNCPGFESINVPHSSYCNQLEYFDCCESEEVQKMSIRTGKFDEDARISFQGIANATGRSRYLVVIKAAELIASGEIEPTEGGKVPLKDARKVAEALQADVAC